MWRAYVTPTSLQEALRTLAEHGPGARIIAGGTDLLVELHRSAPLVPVLIDVTRIGGWDRIWIDEHEQIHVGPTVTHNQAAASTLLAARGGALAQACCEVGTPQVRNRATVTGNLVTASPANDTITALWALDARLTLLSVHGERKLTFPEFYYGMRQTARAADEMVTDIAFPALRPDQRSAFVKLGLRRTNAISVVNAAVVLAFSNGIVSEARIALGSVAPTIIRATEAEAFLVGGDLNEEQIREAAGLAAGVAVPIDDIRGGGEYRRHAVGFLVMRALGNLLRQTGASALPSDSPMLWGSSDGHFPAWARHLLHHGPDDAIECTINGTPTVVRGAAQKRLLEMLRENLGLTGTKEGCGEGECGACTVWMDGIAVLACLVPAPRAHGTNIVTIEGLASADRLHPLQQAFIEEGAVQCGYCTPGFIMAGASMLEEMPNLSREQIKAGLAGNLCRCTGYYRILNAVERTLSEQGAR